MPQRELSDTELERIAAKVRRHLNFKFGYRRIEHFLYSDLAIATELTRATYLEVRAALEEREDDGTS